MYVFNIIQNAMFCVSRSVGSCDKTVGSCDKTMMENYGETLICYNRDSRFFEEAFYKERGI